MEDRPYLPLELIELIIDNLAEGDDTFSSLKSVALVCRAFVRPAQHHIFNTVVINQRDTSQYYERRNVDRLLFALPTGCMLYNLLLQTPGLGGYIRTLVCHVSNYDETRKPWISAFPTQLTRLRSLIINEHPYNDGRGLLASLIHIPTLTHVRLYGVRQFSLSALIPCAGLKTLELSYMEYIPPDLSLPSQSNIGPGRSIQLDHLSLERCHLDIWKQLQEVRYTDGRPLVDLRALKTLVVKFGLDQKSLSVTEPVQGIFESCRGLVEVTIILPNVSHFHGLSDALRGSQDSLKKISLDTGVLLPILGPDRKDPFRELCHELEAMSEKNVIESITIKMKLFSRPQDTTGDEWGALDRALTRSGWRALSRVTVTVKVCWHSLDELTDDSDAVAALQTLPEQQFKGLLFSPTVDFKFTMIDPGR